MAFLRDRSQMCQKSVLGISILGGLMFAFMASSPIPGALKEFVDTDDQTANLVFFYKDHKGETLRRLEEEQKAFEEFLERLREAKDKSEFDEFMNERDGSRALLAVRATAG